jgi:hypothetical protein
VSCRFLMGGLMKVVWLVQVTTRQIIIAACLHSRQLKSMSISSTPQRHDSRVQPTLLSHLNVDLLIHAAQSTILHPFVAWMLPLSLRAVTVPYTHPSFISTVAYAVLLSTFHLFFVWSDGYAYGPPIRVNPLGEVVVIAGGASGLGLAIADFYRMRGTSVAILDVQPLQDDEESGVRWYKCDVSDPNQVAKAAKWIREDVGILTMSLQFTHILPLAWHSFGSD